MSLLCCFPLCKRKSHERTPLLTKSVSLNHRSDDYKVKGEVSEEEKMVLATMGQRKQLEEKRNIMSKKRNPKSPKAEPSPAVQAGRPQVSTSRHGKAKSHEDLTVHHSRGGSQESTTPPQRNSTQHKRSSSSQAQAIQSPQANRRRIREQADEVEQVQTQRTRAKSMHQRSTSVDLRRTNIKALVEKWLQASDEEDRIDVLHDIYRTYDTNSDDSITRRQFRHFYKDFYRELFLVPSRTEYRQMVERLDQENEDDISFKEFRKNFDRTVLPSVRQKIQKRTQVRKMLAHFFSSPPERDENGFSEEEATIFQFYTEDDGQNTLNREGFAVLVAEACTVLNIPFETQTDEMLRDFTNKAYEEVKDLPRKDQRIDYFRFSAVFNDYVLPRLYAILIRTFKNELSAPEEDASDTDSEVSATPYSLERLSVPSESAMRLKRHSATFMPPSLRRGKSILFSNYVFETNTDKQREILMRMFQSYDTDKDGVLSRRELGIFLLSLFDSFGMKDDLSKEDVVNTYDLLAGEAFGGVRFEDFAVWWETMLNSMKTRKQT